MKAFLILLLILLLSSAIRACQVRPYSFCNVSQWPGYNVLYGKVVDTLPHGIKMEVYTVMHGTETRDTVTIWDYPAYVCDTDALRANVIGRIGDTAFVILAVIDSTVTSWEVIGDYRMQDPYAQACVLFVKQDTVRGFIYGDYTAPPGVNVTLYSLSDFLANWQGKACVNYHLNGLSTNDIDFIEDIIVAPNPAGNYTMLQNMPTGSTAELFSADGRQVNSIISNNRQISMSHLAPGTYLLKIISAGISGFKKIIKL
jgi:hypothetical protein